MTEQQFDALDMVLTLIANVALLAFFFWVVFWLHRSPWWLLFPMLFHFSTDKNNHKKQNDG